MLVVQSLAMGIDRMKETILRLLIEAMLEDGIHIRGVYERSDAKVRRQEGMQPWKGFLSEPFDTKVQIVENGVKYIVDVEEGQKTGFSLTRNIIDCPFIKFVREWMCWTALPIQAPLR